MKQSGAFPDTEAVNYCTAGLSQQNPALFKVGYHPILTVRYDERSVENAAAGRGLTAGGVLLATSLPPLRLHRSKVRQSALGQGAT